MTVLLTLILRRTNKSIGNEAQSIQTKKLDIWSSADSAGSANRAGRGNKNLSSTKKLKNQARPKKSMLAKASFFKTDFLIFRVKKAFIHIWNAFTKSLILHHFNPKHHIQIKIDFSGYAIGGISS